MNFRNIQLTPIEMDKILQFKTFGQDWIDRCILHHKAYKYIEAYFDTISDKAVKKGNCYYVGQAEYTRLDGHPISQDDIDVFNVLDRGQSNIIEGKIGDMKIVHKWECDSGD